MPESNDDENTGAIPSSPRASFAIRIESSSPSSAGFSTNATQPVRPALSPPKAPLRSAAIQSKSRSRSTARSARVSSRAYPRPPPSANASRAATWTPRSRLPPLSVCASNGSSTNSIASNAESLALRSSSTNARADATSQARFASARNLGLFPFDDDDDDDRPSFRRPAIAAMLPLHDDDGRSVAAAVERRQERARPHLLEVATAFQWDLDRADAERIMMAGYVVRLAYICVSDVVVVGRSAQIMAK
mmetsp:Transcript_36461/g.77731  ORF Transcript_36461/g.77731 Transcript_36461/m.77731 type:complete len:247 (-) Transcript_36461:96-836(-)